MHLVIDSGNTLAKAAIFENDELVALEYSSHHDWAFLFTMLEKYGRKPLGIIVSDVSDTTQLLHEKLSLMAPVLKMDAHLPCPLKIVYDTPHTLGPDRLAAAIGGWSMFPASDVVVVQAGTCITYEFVSKQAEYHGGSISPGLDMRFKAMHTFTARLPLVKKDKIDFLTGKNTNDAILSGVVNGCIAEIDGIVDQYRQKYPDLKVVLSGGDTFFFDKKLKNRIFASQNLVLRGLNEVLKFNHADFEK